MMAVRAPTGHPAGKHRPQGSMFGLHTWVASNVPSKLAIISWK
jgi:hypothetical protein